ncbi:hypothetical protein SS50377_22286 [Spironucleus salmonicida]|uniref:Uncharacterized protein n=1 Tax=Spironucleus salmonicida TaxID=348837 RepID=V6LCL4_9EUKA|nr:hypothetical protein SS50377_22286 [Spironucleus salmonicida]|eukprot:EST42220.1 Hypothetical protein SS50377_18522 [Spironucleus salmonicida]
MFPNIQFKKPYWEAKDTPIELIKEKATKYYTPTLKLAPLKFSPIPRKHIRSHLAQTQPVQFKQDYSQRVQFLQKSMKLDLDTQRSQLPQVISFKPDYGRVSNGQKIAQNIKKQTWQKFCTSQNGECLETVNWMKQQQHLAGIVGIKVDTHQEGKLVYEHQDIDIKDVQLEVDQNLELVHDDYQQEVTLQQITFVEIDDHGIKPSLSLEDITCDLLEMQENLELYQENDMTATLIRVPISNQINSLEHNLYAEFFDFEIETIKIYQNIQQVYFDIFEFTVE